MIASTSLGVKASYSCHPQYYLIGASERNCTADEVWDGQQPSCVFTHSCDDDPCKNNGICNSDGTCTCLEGWSGTRCELVSIPCTTSPCHNSGVCNEDGACTCPEGWSGNRCELVTFSCIATPCENGGICTIDDRCSCLQGWIGATCEIRAKNKGELKDEETTSNKTDGSEKQTAGRSEQTDESQKETAGSAEQNMGMSVVLPIICIGVLATIIVILIIVVVYVVRRIKGRENRSNDIVEYNNSEVNMKYEPRVRHNPTYGIKSVTT